MPASRSKKNQQLTRSTSTNGDLQEHTAQLESLFANAPAGLGFLDREHRYLRLNAKLAEINGVPAEAHLGRRVSDVLPATAHLLDPILDEVFRTGRPIVREVAGETPKEPGVTRHWLTGFFPVFSGDAQPSAVGAYVIEVTDRIRAEDALRHSEARFHAFVNASSDVVYRMSADWSELRQLEGRGLIADTAASRRDWLREYIHPDDHKPLLRAIARAVRTRSMFELEHRVRRLDGDMGWVVSRAVPIFDWDGAIIEWFGTASDITAHKKAEEALIRSEKLASVGRLASAIAHEINNPLAAVMNLLFLAQNDPDCPPSVRRDLSKAESELKRVSHITRQVLGFYRDSSRPAPVSLGAILDEALCLFEARIIAKGVAIDKQYRQDIRITAVAGDLRQVFANLISNGLDALPDRGTLALRIAECSLRGKPVARITIADSGSGIEPSALPHIFEALFTTKESIGTGLGLWVSKQLLEKHGGSIRFRSSTGPCRQGTTFVIDLPAGAVDSPS
jgi:signal transduction histidine kinase